MLILMLLMMSDVQSGLCYAVGSAIMMAVTVMKMMVVMMLMRMLVY